MIKVNDVIELTRSMTKRTLNGHQVQQGPYRAIIIREGTRGVVRNIQGERALIEFEGYFEPGSEQMIVVPVQHEVLVTKLRIVVRDGRSVGTCISCDCLISTDGEICSLCSKGLQQGIKVSSWREQELNKN